MTAGSQTRLHFVDTNIWLYAFIPTQDPDKSAKSKALIQQSDVIISPQVINEVCVNLIKKAQFDESSIRQLINSFYDKYNVVGIDNGTLLKSSELREKHQFSFWDSLIVSSALSGGAEILYTEDMSDGLVIEGHLTIINPLTA